MGDVTSIRKLIGTHEGAEVVKMIFRGESGNEIGRIQVADDPLSITETVLEDGEEIVGVYGQHGRKVIYSLGFIVRKPSV